jgi:LacI family transcriptional regulator
LKSVAGRTATRLHDMTPDRIKRVTIQSVADHAGVSIATVSNVLNGSGRVGPDSRKRVLEAVEALAYRPNSLASSLRSRRSRLIGLVIPDITNSFFAAIAYDLEEFASDTGYDFAVVTSRESVDRERQRVQALLSRQIDGLIAIPASDTSLLTTALNEASLPPLVVLDRGLNLPEVDTVGTDGEGGGYAATQHLLHLHHERIGVLVPTLDLGTMRDRVAGHSRALKEAHLSISPRILVGGPTVDGSRSAVEQELQRADRPTAIFAASSVAALGAIKAIHALDLKIPRDISLIGFDDAEWMVALRPSITTVSQPTKEMVKLSWNLLVQRMVSGRSVKGGYTTTRLPCALQLRESTGLPPISVEPIARRLRPSRKRD